MTKCSLYKGTTSVQILPLCFLHLVAAYCSYINTCAQDGLDTMQLAMVVCSNNWCKYSTCTHGGHHLLRLALVVFFLGALVHLVMCALTNRYTLQLVLWWVVAVVVVFH